MENGIILYNKSDDQKSKAFKKSFHSVVRKSDKTLNFDRKKRKWKDNVVEALARYLDKIYIGERENAFRNCQKGLDIKFNNKIENIAELADKYHYILAYYEAARIFQADQPGQIEKVKLQDYYGLTGSTAAASKRDEYFI